MSASVRSMTGFARVRRNSTQGDLIVSLRGVNHRGLDLQFHLQPEMEPYETAIRKAIQGRVVRGHLDVRVNLIRITGGAASYNKALMETWLAAFRQAAQEYQVTGEPDLNAAFRIPGMLSGDALGELQPDFEAQILDAIEEALARLNSEREREGAGTAAAVLRHHDRIKAAAAEMESIRESVAPMLRARLEEKLGDLLNATVMDPARLAQEAAILADRSDISEELTRLQLHTNQLAELLDQGGEVGKKMEFLVQEMHRESNTILSKSTGVGEPGRRLTELGLVVKADIEKIREQSLNLE